MTGCELEMSSDVTYKHERMDFNDWSASLIVQYWRGRGGGVWVRAAKQKVTETFLQRGKPSVPQAACCPMLKVTSCKAIRDGDRRGHVRGWYICMHIPGAKSGHLLAIIGWTGCQLNSRQSCNGLRESLMVSCHQ
jgi:hypothetical protein